MDQESSSQTSFSKKELIFGFLLSIISGIITLWIEYHKFMDKSDNSQNIDTSVSIETIKYSTLETFIGYIILFIGIY